MREPEKMDASPKAIYFNHQPRAPLLLSLRKLHRALPLLQLKIARETAA